MLGEGWLYEECNGIFFINLENSDKDANRDTEDTNLVQEHCNSHVSDLSICW